MRSLWTGYLSFGLVSIPIKLYSAVDSKSFSFRMLHRKDMSPLTYKRWCPADETEVAWEDIVKGVEVRKGQYYVIPKDKLEQFKPEKSDAVEIVKFVDRMSIDPIYFNKHYYVGPENTKEKAYFLFREVLQNTGKVAIGRFVMREKEYVCSVESYRKGLLLTTLNYEYEIRDIAEIRELSEEVKLAPKEIGLAEELITRLYEERFDISEFRDDYEEKIRETIRKAEEGELVEVEQVTKERTQIPLLEALKASLDEADAGV